MVVLERLAEGLAVATDPTGLLWVGLGTIIGIMVGAAPGLGPTLGMAMMVPIAIRLPPEYAIFLFVAISTGANFGNSIPAVLVRVPGTPAALLTALEGYPFQQRGEAGRALSASLLSSVIGQFVGVLAFIAFVIPLARIAVQLLFPEVFAIVIFGLVAAVSMVTKSPVKGLAAIALGLVLALPGPDPLTGAPRLTFGISQLIVGLPVIPVVVGLLAFREVFAAARDQTVPLADGKRVRRLNMFKGNWIHRRDWRDLAIPIALGSVVGTFVGAVPGAGSAVAGFVTYQIVKVVHHKDEAIGKGSLRALAGVDSAGNSANGGELIPTLGLGIPGSPNMIVLMAVLAAQGLVVGPQLMEMRPGLVYATFGGLMMSVALLLVVGVLIIGPSVYLSRISRTGTMVVTLVLVVVGIFGLRWSMFDVWVCLVAGIIGFVLDEHGYPIAPMALAFILGTLLESTLRRGLVMTGGLLGFVTRPVAAVILLVAAAMLIVTLLMNRRSYKRERAKEQHGER